MIVSTHFVIFSPRYFRQFIKMALKKTKIEVKTEPAQVVQVKPETTPKTNGHAAVEVKPQVQQQQQQQQIKKIVKQQQHLPQTNLVTTATTVLMKPTVYTVTQPMQAVHIGQFNFYLIIF